MIDLSKLASLQSVDAAARAALSRIAEPVELDADTLVMTQGDPHPGVYFVLEGTLMEASVDSDGAVLDRNPLDPGDCVGPLGALSGEPATATVTTTSACRLGHVRPEALPGLLDAFDDLRAWLAARAQARLIRRGLRRSPLFAEARDAILDALGLACDWVDLPGGESLFVEGEVGDAVYLLEAGRLRITVGERTLGEVGVGDVVGEMALLSDRPRSATVTAVRDSRLIRLPAEAFDQMVSRWPESLRPISRLVVSRFQQGIQAGRRVDDITTIAVIGAGGWPGASAFAAELTEALGSAIRVDPGSVHVDHDAAPARRHAALLDWLGRLELQHRYVVYDGGAEDHAWCDRCLRQADRILIVGPAGAPPPQSPIEAKLFADPRYRERTELAIVHPAEADQPRGTAAWFVDRPVSRHHHVKRGDAASLARLARRVGGRWVGLALSGGGIRGFAHLGVMLALEEAGIVVDVLSGTSAGAIVGTQYAAGHRPRDILERTEEAMRRYRPNRNLTLPIYSIAGRKFGDLLTELTGPSDLEDYWLECLCVSADIRSATVMAHGRGPAARWVRASTAAPGIIAPIIEGEHLLVDGGILNNVPADVLAARGGGRIIISDVSTPSPQPIERSLVAYPSPWRTLWQKLTFRKRPKLPGIGAILAESLTCAALPQRAAAFALADLLIDVEMPHVGLFNVDQMRDAFEAGYGVASRVLSEADGWA